MFGEEKIGDVVVRICLDPSCPSIDIYPKTKGWLAEPYAERPKEGSYGLPVKRLNRRNLVSMSKAAQVLF